MPTWTFSRRNAATPLLALFLLAAGFAPADARAQTVCDLTAAKDDFETGLFDQVIAMLEPCIEKGFTPAEEEEALALLAKTWLALDDLDKADAAIARLLAQNPGFRPLSDDPLPFQRRVGQLREKRPAAVVTSVSKTPESLRLAPATVVVVTAEEIARRGYLDLEQVLHDLPGFDFSLGNGDLYSTFYQRGYRSRNDRTLFLVDGIEENDLWSNAVHLSRQYPLTNVERVEVIYGPASTLYGPNAFTGVINIITRDPGEMVPENRRTASLVTAGGGQWNTRWGDLTLAGRHGDKNISFSLSARVYQSDEWDLSEYPNWDYDPSFFDSLDYSRLVKPIKSSELTAEQKLSLSISPYARATAEGFEITPAGVEKARELDKAALGQLVEGKLPRYSDLTNDWLLGARLRFSNLTLGFQSWRREEGFNSWYTDNLYAGADNGTLWVPQQSFFFLKYDRELGPKLGLNITTSYKRHTLAGNTREQQMVAYATGGLLLRDLVTNENESYWQRTKYSLLSEQFKAETTLVYNYSKRLLVVGGFDTRNSLIQGDYLLAIAPAPRGEDRRADGNPEFFEELDAGAFVQASYQLRDSWKIVAGSRFDHNQQRRASGYGTVASPRLAVLYSPRSWVFKAIYAEAFKAPSNFNRYATAPGLRERDNPDLAPERVRNLELSASWQPRPELSLEASAYRARYSDIVSPRDVGDTLQNQNRGSLEITGLQGTAKWSFRWLDVDASYTWTDPRTDPLDTNGEPLRDVQGRRVANVRFGEIAEHRANLGLTGRFADRWTLNLRANAASERRAGQSFELLSQPPDQRLDRFGRPVDPQGERISPAVAVHTAVTYQSLLPGVRLQLVVNNLLDARYDDPGIDPANDVSFARLLPQPGRAVFLRLSYER